MANNTILKFRKMPRFKFWFHTYCGVESQLVNITGH